jgi:hypothetical protein
MTLNTISLPQITLLSQSPLTSSLLDTRRELWEEFGRLKISDSTRKQYVKATAEDGAQASRISVSLLIIALQLQKQSLNF